MSSGFVTEKEVEETKRLRQEEWDRVRKPDDPEEVPLAPEQLPDRRSLFDRLNEQKMKKQEEFEEAHKFKNLVKGLDDDEADFLDHVDRKKWEEEHQKRVEEAKELSDFRSKVAELREKDLDVLIKQEIGLIKTDKKPAVSTDDDLLSIGAKKTSQSKLLAGLVKRKSVTESSSSAETCSDAKKPRHDSHTKDESPPAVSTSAENNSEIPSVPYKGNLVCIGVLPGLESYSNSSSESGEDDSSSESDPENLPVRDLCGRKIVAQQEEDKSGCKEKK